MTRDFLPIIVYLRAREFLLAVQIQTHVHVPSNYDSTAGYPAGKVVIPVLVSHTAKQPKEGRRTYQIKSDNSVSEMEIRGQFNLLLLHYRSELALWL